MPRLSDSAAVDVDVRRAAVRISSAALLRGMDIIARVHENDLIQGLVFTAIWVANVSELRRDPAENLRFARARDIPPDDLRKPVSVFAISTTLKIPYETTRRYANRLVEKGFCVRVGRQGLVVPQEVFARPEFMRSLEDGHDWLMTMLGDLAAIGVYSEREPDPPTGA